MQPTLGGHASVHSVSDCQRHTLYYPTCGVPSLFDFTKRRRAKRSSTSSTTTRTAWWSVCTLIFFISDKVHVYSGEGRKMATQHVMMISINQPCSNISWPLCEPICVFSLLVSLKERRVGSLPSIEIGLITLLSHMSVICQEEVR